MPPRSTPIEPRFGDAIRRGRGYHTRPDGGRREALPGLQGRQGEGEGALRAAPRAVPAPPKRSPARRPTAPAGDGGSRSRVLALVAPRPSSGSPPATSPSAAASTDANERLPKAVEAAPRAAGRDAALEAVADSPARHRRRPDGRPRRRAPLRLDPPAPHRARPPPTLVPLDPARPAGRHPRLRPVQDQRRLPARRAGADDADGARAHRAAAEPRRDGRLRRLPQRDRRPRRGRGRRAEADPLQPLRLPLQDAGALPAVAGLALREGAADDGRPARADLLAHPREPARPVRERPHPRRRASRPSSTR